MGATTKAILAYLRVLCVHWLPIVGHQSGLPRQEEERPHSWAWHKRNRNIESRLYTNIENVFKLRGKHELVCWKTVSVRDTKCYLLLKKQTSYSHLHNHFHKLMYNCQKPWIESTLFASCIHHLLNQMSNKQILLSRNLYHLWVN